MRNILAQAVVHQEKNAAEESIIFDHNNAFILGPNAYLVRYTEPSEKLESFVDDYNNITGNSVNILTNRPASSVIDENYTRIFLSDAVLLYYTDLIGGGDGTISMVTGMPEQIKTTAATGFVKNTVYNLPRLTGLKDRDVKIGDVVILTHPSYSKAFETEVIDILPDITAGSMTSATGMSDNVLSQPSNQIATAPSVNPTGGGSSGGSLAAGTYYIQYTFVGPFGETWGSASHTGASPVSFSIVAGNIPRVTLPALPAGATGINIYLTQPGGAAGTETLYASNITTTTFNMSAAHTTGGAAVPASARLIAGTANNVQATANCSAYKGNASGRIYEIYTIQVTQGSISGDATTARLRVTSASGLDDVESLTPAPFGSNTNIGSRGLVVRWTTSASHNFIVGQTWQVVARQAFVQPVVTPAGTYTGPELDKQIAYIVEVTQGGFYADPEKPVIMVSRPDGGDSGGPITVTNHSVPVPLGNFGGTISFSANGSNPGLCKGDRFYITGSSSATSHYKTLVLKDSLPVPLRTLSDLNLYLGIRKDIEVPKENLINPPNFNWELTGSSLTVNPGIQAYDASLTHNGVPFPVPVIKGKIYGNFRAWKSNLSGSISKYEPSNANEAVIKHEVSQILGPVTPDNPLAYAVFKAAINSNKSPVYFSGVMNPGDKQEWLASLDIIKSERAFSNVVPLTKDVDVLKACSDLINSRSNENIGGEWKVCWFSPELLESIPIVTANKSQDQQTVLATLTDNPAQTNLQYTLITITSDNANLIDLAVKPGDEVRYIYTSDSFGNESYKKFIVKKVINNQTLLLESGHVSEQSVPQKIEIWRNLTKREVVDNVISQAQFFSNKRVRLVWPPQVEDNGFSVDGFYLCAALAGLVSGIMPHQGIRNLEIKGFSSTNLSTGYLSLSALSRLVDGGVFVVNESGGTLYTYGAVTTDVSSTANKEELVVRIDDSVHHYIYTMVQGSFGVSNMGSGTAGIVELNVNTAIRNLKQDTSIPRLGSVISDGSVKKIEQHKLLPDRLIVELEISRPFPLNDAIISLLI